ncbi:MAG: phosphoribosylformylglycinamidine synthase [Mariprofundales bacterium]
MSSENSHILIQLLGKPALSNFRRQQLLHDVREQNSNVQDISARFVHLISLKRSLNDNEMQTLSRILDYGVDYPNPQQTINNALVTTTLVVPRLGTISPWSSSATDIAHLCGLDAVLRIERAMSFSLFGITQANTQANKLLALLHDRMTETVLLDEQSSDLVFDEHAPAALVYIDILQDGIAVLYAANNDMGLALSEDECIYLYDNFIELQRNPTDAELMMFAQANSEHCRHKIFNADFIVDNITQQKTLFSHIRATHEAQSKGVLSAYHDNAAVIASADGDALRFYANANGIYKYNPQKTNIMIKVETHNHPTAIAPFSGAATGAGGEIRDEGATGIGGKPKAGLCGFSVSNLHIPDFEQPWEHSSNHYGRPDRIASALEIMRDAPIGAAAFNNEFGRPNLLGYFRTFCQVVNGDMRGYHKPIMLAGGMGNIAAIHTQKNKVIADCLIIQLGGPALRIGLGGGAASSMDTGSNDASLDFDSVQRGNPEMQRRAQEVLDRCCQMGECGADNPILFIHDIGAGGLSNAVPELVHDAGLGGWVDLRKVHNLDLGMSPMQIWCNEAQERYMLAISAESLPLFSQICQRERCLFAVLGTFKDVGENGGHLYVEDSLLGEAPVDMELEVLLGKPPKLVRNDKTSIYAGDDFSSASLDITNIAQIALNVLKLPAVADKSFLINIADRSVGGFTARDQCVGPWQVPVADVAVTCRDYTSYAGEAMSMGERTPVALLNSAAAARMAIAEALTNLIAADIGGLKDMANIKLSANWMAACGVAGEDAALYEAVQAASEFCLQLGICIPVGKDSLSMKTTWHTNEENKQVISPVSLVVSAFAPVNDVRSTLTPVLRNDSIKTDLILLDLANGQRLGGSALAQVHGAIGQQVADIDADKIRDLFALMAEIRPDVLACHDRSDGGLLACAVEMAFAGHCGIGLHIEELGHDAISALFCEEIGLLLQVRRTNCAKVLKLAAQHNINAYAIGSPRLDGQVVINNPNRRLLDIPLSKLREAWSETSYRMQALRDNPECARQDFAAVKRTDAVGLFARLSFDPEDDLSDSYPQSAPVIIKHKPRIAILREQGVNGHVEMAAAFDRAGFECVDVHGSDIITGRHNLRDMQGMVACGGFSFGDILGAGEGWAKSIKFNEQARDIFAEFFNRNDTFALGVCNGCQMMSNLHDMIPGATHWPRFVRNISEQFEARLVMVEIPESPSLFFDGMAGSCLPVVVSHGEGRAVFAEGAQSKVIPALRYINANGSAATQYPKNPNGSPDGLTGFTTTDGRFTIMMPHPERLFRSVQFSWHPDDWGEDSPWLRMFRNAKKWVS